MSDHTDVILGALARLEAGQRELGSQITTLAAEFGARQDQLDARMGQFEARLDRFETRLGQFETRMGQFETRMGQFETRLGQFETRMGQFETRMGQFETRLDQLAARLDRSEAVHIQTRAELMARMDRLQDTMTEMRNDVVVNFGMIERLQGAHDSTREELKAVNEIVILLVKRIRLLEADVRTLKGEP